MDGGRPRRPARGTIRRRRAVAVAVAALATAAVWFAVARDGGEESTGVSATDLSSVPASVATAMREMSIAERVDQLLLLGFDGTDASTPLIAELRERALGGVLLDGANWIDREQGAALIAAVRAAAVEGDRISPLIAVAQEAGPYRTLAGMPPAESELEIGQTASPRRTETWSRDAAQAVRSVGVDLDLFPVADVASVNGPLAGRAFSDDPAVASSLTAAAVRGCREARIACAAAHFPGLGAASQDTDRGPATVSLDADALDARDLAPFRAAFDEGVPAVVLSLAFYAAYDSVTPAALSPTIATGLLRGDLGYAGVAITDDLGAGAVKAGYGAPKAAVAAIGAGADMVQIASPADQSGVRDALLEAIRSGAISEDRLDEAVGRVLELKRSVGLLRR